MICERNLPSWRIPVENEWKWIFGTETALRIDFRKYLIEKDLHASIAHEGL